jgi:hypothetical protein
MPEFVYPLISLVLDFLCLLMCLKFIFSKRGAVWIVPVFLSLIFLAGSALCLLAEVSPRADASMLIFAQALSIFFLGASIIWLFVIIVFRIALNPEDIQSVKARRNKAEADFLKKRTAKNTFWEATKEEKPNKVAKKPKLKPKARPHVDPYEEVKTVSPRRYKNAE